MHVDVVIHHPDRVTEPLKAVELLPLGRLSLIDFKLDIFTNIVGPSSEDKHERPNEKGGVLISGERFLCTGLIWSLDPVPSAVSVTS